MPFKIVDASASTDTYIQTAQIYLLHMSVDTEEAPTSSAVTLSC